MNNEDMSIENQDQQLARQSTGYQGERQTTEIAAIGNPASVEELQGQVSIIQRAMKAVMKTDEHFGTIPGTSKPTLLKPGAEKLSLLFRLAPEYNIHRYDMGRGHREYEVVCTLKHITSGNTVGQGVGSCNSMESRYRYRTENTGAEVPKDYWADRDKSLLGGEQYSPKKVKGQWLIFHKVEHDNPSDYYNTVLKMAKKRAHVDAILTATAASDIFTQDIEDMEAVVGTTVSQDAQSQQPKPDRPPKAKQQAQPAQDSGTEKPWLNKTPKGSNEITDDWNAVMENIRSGQWGIGDVLDRYKVSKANRAELEDYHKEVNDGNLPFD